MGYFSRKCFVLPSTVYCRLLTTNLLYVLHGAITWQQHTAGSMFQLVTHLLHSALNCFKGRHFLYLTIWSSVVTISSTTCCAAKKHCMFSHSGNLLSVWITCYRTLPVWGWTCSSAQQACRSLTQGNLRGSSPERSTIDYDWLTH